MEIISKSIIVCNPNIYSWPYIDFSITIKADIIWIDEDENADQYTAWCFWAPDCKEMFYQVLNRDQNDLQVLSTNPETGKN